VDPIDSRPVVDGKRGPIATALTDAYDRAIHGALPKYEDWLTRTYAGRHKAAS